jgi:filamentous hemagglutinin family protein
MIAKSWFNRGWQWKIGDCVALVVVLSIVVSENVLAQIVPDKTLGVEGSVVKPNVNIQGIPSDRIDGGATRGANLFHSFQEFNVGSGRGAYFANPTGIENILTRVTGGNPSNILGRLGVLGGANLFLLNPNGIIFGPNASLDIQGSFMATTADRVQLGDSGYFSATQPQTSSLLSVSPGALFFNAVASQPGSIINRGNLSTPKHLTLAAGNLDLQGQLKAGENLTLQAQDTVKVRDSAAIPFIGSAGENLLVQGNHRVDIFALTHPESGLFSGGDMVLRSSNTVGGDARYWSGGSFRIEQLDGSLGNLFSLHGPIMRVREDVFIQTYKGASLHILAGGKVEIPGYVRIQGADIENGLVETINLADGTTVSINGKSEPTLDIRAGVNPDVIGEQILSLTGTGTSIPSSADIKIGTILFTLPDNTSIPLAGKVLLTNQYQPNSSLNGDIQVTQSLDVPLWGAFFMAGGAGNPSVAINSRGGITLDGTVNTGAFYSASNTDKGGKIALTAQNNITTGGLDSNSNGAGNGGNITLLSTGGSINTSKGALNSTSNTGNGGAISLIANGKITTGGIDSQASGSGDGGEITLTSNNGAIDTTKGTVTSQIRNNSGGTGKAGAIVFKSKGDIETAELDSSAESGNGSLIHLTSINGNIDTTRGTLFSDSRSGNGGEIRLEAFKSKITTGDINSEVSGSGKGGDITLTSYNGAIDTTNGTVTSQIRNNSGGTGKGGAIVFKSKGDIETAELDSSAESGNGSLIHLTSINGNIDTTRGTLFSDSRSGNGGEIRLEAFKSKITTGDINSEASGSGKGGDITLTSYNGAIDTTNGTVTSQIRDNSGGTGNGGAIVFKSKGDIETAELDSSAESGNGGEIALTAQNNITTRDLYSASWTNSLSNSGNAGQGGAINLTAANGSITTGNLLSPSVSIDVGNADQGGAISLTAANNINITGNLSSYSISSDGNTGQGGAINLTAANGSITTGDLFSYSLVTFHGNAGQGGAIALTAPNNINIGNLLSSSVSFDGNAGHGGAISLRTTSGDISGIGNQSTVLSSSSISKQGTAGSGGNVALEAKNNISNLEILTLSSDSQSGTVQITGLGDLWLTNTNILTSKQVNILFLVFSTTLKVDGKGQSGNVDVSSLGNLTFNNSSIQSDTKGSNNAGNVTVSSPGLITLNNSFIRSNTRSTGAAGSIDIKADQGITLVGSDSELFAGTINQGKAGDITLTTPQLTLQNGTNIATTTESSSAAGNITLQSHPNTENLNINLAPGTSISASTSNQGSGGNIEIKAPNTITIQGQSTITTGTTGAGNAGKIEVNSRNLDIQKTELSTSTTGSGNAGDITLDTSTLTVARGAKVFALTNGLGNSGTIRANASTAMNLGIGVEDFSPVLSVETSSEGQPGSIIINTPSLTLSNTARITATATNTAKNPQGGGSITLNASTMDLAGVVGVFAETQGQTPAGTLTLKPYENQSTLNLTLAPESRVSASTTGSGKGGNLIVQAPEAITIQGRGQLAVKTTGDGAAGNLSIDTQKLTIADGAIISASTSSKNPEGTGGSIDIKATESFNLTNASLGAESTGAAPAGNIKIKTPNLTATNGTIATSSKESSGGGITITADKIHLFGNSDITTT